jgi:Family of unknown function (DUF6155)
MSKLTTREVRKYLESKSHADLVSDIVLFFTQFDGVKEYYSTQLGHGYSEELLEKYKTIIRKEFFPTRGFGSARLSIARKAINDYKKVSRNLLGLVDLMLFYVEMGVRYTNEYGDINEAFYNSMESVYDGALKLITTNGLQDQYRTRCHKIVTDTRGIGWGFHDNLSGMYHTVFDD